MSAIDVQARAIIAAPYDPSWSQDAPFDSWSPVQQVPSGPLPGAPYPPAGPGQGELPPGPPPNVPPPGSGADPVPDPYPVPDPRPVPDPGGELPPGPPPNVPPPPGQRPVPPAEPVPPGGPVPPPSEPPPTDPTPVPPPKDDGGFNALPWIVGAGAIGAGVAGIVAFRTGAHNVRALRATAAAFDSGAMHQGGLQAIRDAQLGARFTGGIGLGEYVAVALPGVNRFGTGGKLTAVARGHLDHAELLSASAALQRGAGDAVSVSDPLRRTVLSGLEEGRSMRSVLDDLDRSADGAKPAFDNPQLARYWDRTSIVERGPRSGAQHVTSGVDANRPELALRAGDDGTATRRQIIETGRQVRLNQLVAGRGADLDGRGLASGIGTVQSVGVSRLNPEMQRAAIATSGVDPKLVESVGLNGAFTQRWTDRLAQGASSAAP